MEKEAFLSPSTMFVNFTYFYNISTICYDHSLDQYTLSDADPDRKINSVMDLYFIQNSIIPT